MDLNGIFRGMTISGSALAAETARVDVVAKNLANAEVVSTPEGGPYKRRELVFETVLDAVRGSGDIVGQVRVGEEVVDEESPFREVYDPTHPQADPETGILKLSNVNTAFEMVDLLAATRAYEANLKAMGAYRDMVRQAIRILES